jgi:hypothetical protein
MLIRLFLSTLIFYDLAAHLKHFHSTLVCRGTPVAKHWYILKYKLYTTGKNSQNLFISIFLGGSIFKDIKNRVKRSFIPSLEVFGLGYCI